MKKFKALGCHDITRWSLSLALFASLASPVRAQDEEEVAPEDTEEAANSEESGESENLQLAPIDAEMPDIGEAPAALEEEEELASEEADDSALLLDAAPTPAVAAEQPWQQSGLRFTLHGYFRLRGERWDTLSVGRSDGPFAAFRPVTADAAVPDGGCGDSSVEGEEDPLIDGCSGELLRFANTRLRLEPVLSLSEDVRVRMTIDAFDNMVLGSTPDYRGYVLGSDGLTTGGRVPGAPLDSFALGQNPPQDYRNSLRDSIYVRHAWAEVTNRRIGQLRFGRMPAHWGLGLLFNDGSGIDSDFSTDIDRIMGITQLYGIQVQASWDFASKGLLRQFSPYDVRGFAVDGTPADDVTQFTLAAVYRQDEEVTRERIENGDFVLNAGLHFLYRSQFLSSAATTVAFPTTSADTLFVRRDAQIFAPDLWVQFLWGDLRIEAEALLMAGSVDNIGNAAYTPADLGIMQFGFALEADYRLLNEKLEIRLAAGAATGDSNVDGLSNREDALTQNVGTGADTMSFMQFHPNYRVDLILWRNILGRVGGAWYAKPGVSYDIIHSPFGQRFGAGVDFVYSHATAPVQTYGAAGSLGLEIDTSVYYRSEDGPDLLDGFYAQVNYGILFPFSGLGYPNDVDGRSTAPAGFKLQNAQVLRLILGIQF